MSAGYFASLNGLPLFQLELVLPFSGIWHADVEMSLTIDLSGPQTLILNSAPYVCTAIRAIDFAGTRSARLVGGQAGWRKIVPPKPYASPAGVPTTVVLADVAATVQEIPPVVDPSVPPTVGMFWSRPGGLASLTLQALLGPSWWMDPTGTVQSAPRLPTPVVTPFVCQQVHGAPGVYEIGTDFPSDWTPGKVFVSPVASGTISRVMHQLDADGLKTTVMVS